jgi:hypothetical protein
MSSELDYTEFKKGETPNEKELRLFEQEKMDIYKGTFVVCIVYGLSALLLLIIILFTDWGREYIYNKFAPAVITYILGSLIIIIYLLNAIFTLQPRKIGSSIDSDNYIMCPDFWKLQIDTDKLSLKSKLTNINTNITSNKNVIEDIGEKHIKFKCAIDPNVYGNNDNYFNMKKELSTLAAPPFERGFNDYATANAVDDSLKPSDYTLLTATGNTKYSTSTYKDELKKYAEFSGGYANTGYLTDSTKINTIRMASATANAYTTGNAATAVSNYAAKKPLICNEVYPLVLGVLDQDKKEKNEVSCEYAKQCGISWSSLKCK